MSLIWGCYEIAAVAGKAFRVISALEWSGSGSER